jgi:glutamate dehydrogenase (NAD(P)+)
VYILEAAAKHWDIDLSAVTVAIQGFGNVGSWAARELHERNIKVVAVSDVSGARYCGDGFDVDRLVGWSVAHRPLSDIDVGDDITNEELIELECDVLIPAALGEVINSENADRVQAKVLIEAANHPTTPSADKILEERGVKIVPDILSNAGGVTGSYFEWAQNIQQFKWKEERFNNELQDAMGRAFAATVAFAEKREVSMRRAAFALGMERVARAARLRGYV